MPRHKGGTYGAANVTWADRSDEPDSLIRRTCLNCGAELIGNQRQFCCDYCKKTVIHERQRKKRQAEAEQKRQTANDRDIAFWNAVEERKQAEAKSKAAREEQESLCRRCVWKNQYGHCVMPSCFRKKGIGYPTKIEMLPEGGTPVEERRDDAAEMGRSTKSIPQTPAGIGGV